jgi:hypothetical protein
MIRYLSGEWEACKARCSRAVVRPGNVWIAFLHGGPELLCAATAFREALMAHREQHGNKEKKKPKQDKNNKDKAPPAPFAQPELVRKPHKAKEQR